jgi:hypothetical protein
MENAIVSARVKRLLHVRQFVADVIPATDVRFIVCVASVALFLAWLL